MNRVVVTGLCPISAVGKGKEEFFEGLFEGENKAEKIPAEYEKNYKFTSTYRVPAPNINMEDLGLTPVYNKLLGGNSKYAVYGSYKALEDAGFDIITKDKGFGVDIDAKVILGLGLSSVGECFDGYESHVNNIGRFNRLSIPLIMPNAASAWVSILFGLKGENYTLNASCASGTYAIGKSYEEIKEGKAKVVISGGVEYLKDGSGTSMRGFDTLGVLTKSDRGIAEPFSQSRSGFLFSDGAGAILVLEELNHALERGATIYAEIVDFKKNSDAFNIVKIEESGEKIKELMKEITRGKEIDYINSHGTGTILNDQVEAEVIKEVLGQKPYVNSSKGILGHNIGASGALEAIICVDAIKNSRIHKNHIKNPIEGINLPLEDIKVEVNSALSMSYGFGGHNGALLFWKYS